MTGERKEGVQLSSFWGRILMRTPESGMDGDGGWKFGRVQDLPLRGLDDGGGVRYGVGVWGICDDYISVIPTESSSGGIPLNSKI